MDNAQTSQAGDGFIGQHGGAIVGHQGTWQPSLHERLRQSVYQALGRFVEIPLQVADEPRAVVDHPEQQRLDPAPRTCQHLAFGVMEIEVPEGRHLIDFEAPDLQPFEAVTGQ